MRILIIGTLEGYITSAGKIAMQRGAKVSHVDDVEAGLRLLREGQGSDLVLVDVSQDVASLVKQLEIERIHIPVVACGLGVDKTEAVAAIRAGAKEYLPLPPDAELIAAVLQAIAEDSNDLIFRDPLMQRAYSLAEQIATSDANILITGESGTGKEVMARFVHSKSKRKDKPFVSVNCAAIPENLLESELFGHEKGAFTGAIARRVGKFEEANGGTLLLDEISEMDPRLQAKLLRAIQEREIDRVGGSHPVKVDIRLLATSNRDLLRAIQEGQFREDLYFRLNVINIEIPPLRARKQDILVLAEHFVEKYAKANGVAPKPFSPAAHHAIETHEWIGNVRELENTMHRAILLSQGDAIDVDDVFMAGKPSPQKVSAEGLDPSHLVGMTMAEVEKDLIINTLEHCLGNRTHAANILGISIRTLRNKLKQYDVEETAPKGAYRSAV